MKYLMWNKENIYNIYIYASSTKQMKKELCFK